MKPIRRVVVATDFSPGSSLAVERAVQLARLHGACLDLVHAFDASAWHSLRAVFDLNRLGAEPPPETERHQRLVALAEALASQGGLEVQSHFALGVPGVVIEARARAMNAAAVVIALRSDPAAPGISATLRRVLRSATCPVLVVRSPVAGAYQRVLTAVDLREVSMGAAALAVGMAPTAVHRLLYVIDTAWEQEVRRGQAETPPFGEVLESMHAQATQRLAALAQELGQQPGVKASVDVEVVDAVAARGIVARATAWSADCVVVGHHGHGLVAESLLGTTALDVIHHAACDVLVVS